MYNMYNAYSPYTQPQQQPQLTLQDIANILARKVVGNPDKGYVRIPRPQNLPNGLMNNFNSHPFYVD